ncbi:MAG TPA: hypothetical protein VKR52_18500 [Terracidiphilus sp.]|nr:hypothetical protein [Terracidiphilus sp.]
MKPTTKRRLYGALGVLAVAWVGFVAYIDWAMHQPPEVFGRVMMHMPMPAYFLFPFETMWTQARFGHVNPGGQAPDFTVKTLEAKDPVQLGSLWASRPVVLVFGSYT